MKLDHSSNCPFNSGDSPFGDVVLSSRARLARNLEGFPFVNQASESDSLEVTSLLHRITENPTHAGTLEWVDIDDLDPITCAMIVERHLASPKLVHGTHSRAIAVGSELARSVMINEEDHIRIQSIRPGLQLEEVYCDVKSLDESIEEIIAYAFHDEFGFLTACPTNVGTGARFSVMLHLPGLKLIKDLTRIRNACQAMSLAIRGYRGEGSKVYADLFQVSNQVTLGFTEEQLLNILIDEFLPPVIEWERKARMQIVESNPDVLDDQVFRSMGILENARLLNLEEAMQCLGDVRLGICTQRITDIEINSVNKLFIELHPGHLRRKFGEEIPDSEIPKYRCKLIQETIFN